MQPAEQDKETTQPNKPSATIATTQQAITTTKELAHQIAREIEKDIGRLSKQDTQGLQEIITAAMTSQAKYALLFTQAGKQAFQHQYTQQAVNFILSKKMSSWQIEAYIHPFRSPSIPIKPLNT